MKRNHARTFVAAIVVALVSTQPAGAQSARLLRIGYVAGISAAADAPRFDAFRRGLREAGHVEGRSIVVDTRYASGQLDKLATYAAELAALGPDVFVTIGTPATAAVKKAGGGRPIVFMSVTDPVDAGFVASLARPGGNITGITNIAAQLAGKRLELLKELHADLVHVAVLWEPRNPGSAAQWADSEAPASQLGIDLLSMGVNRVEELDTAFHNFPKTGRHALVVTLTPLTASHQRRIADLAIKARVPAICPDITYARGGCLMSYCPTFAATGADVARYVNRILKGAKPADLPVEQPTTFELVINRKTATALGLAIPVPVLSRADQLVD